MKINPIIIIASILLTAGITYYFYHHKININVDITSDKGSKSHMDLQHDIPSTK